MSTPITNIPTTVSYSVGSSPSTGPFTIPFAFFSTSDITVYVGSYTAKTLGTDYTVSGTLTGGGYPSGGTVTLTVAVSNTWVVITRAVPIQRVTQLPVSGKFDIDQLNQDLNVSYAIAQQLQTGVNNSIHIPVDDYATAPTTVLPKAASRANLGLKFDSSGNVTVTAADPDAVITAAAASATAAATSATTASTQASAAASSASTASTAATTATTQAGIATAAAAALPNAAAIGNGKVPLSNGTTWTGTTVGVGDMLKSDNLSGLGNTTTARSNLGLGTAAVLASDTDTTLAANSDSNVATQKATKAYADLKAALAAVNAFTKAQRGTPVVLTDGATIAVDASLGNNFEVKLGGNRTLGVPTSIAAGQSGSFQVYQDSTGSRTLAYSWCYGFAGGTAPTLTTTALGRDKLSYDVVRGQSSTVTITIATPGVVTYTGHGLQTGDWVQITTTGALPTGLTASTTYWVVYVDANSFSLATTKANAAAGTKIATSGSQSGTHTLSCINIDIAAAKDFR